MAGPGVFLFDSGTLALDGVEVPVPFFLIRHPEGDVVVDGGNPLAVARDAQAHWGPLVEEFDAHMRKEDHCAAQLASHKHPRRLAVVDAIPRTAPTGQVERRLLVERLS